MDKGIANKITGLGQKLTLLTRLSQIHGLIHARLKNVLARFGHDEAEQFIVRLIIASIVLSYASMVKHDNDIELLSFQLSYGQVLAFTYLLTLVITNVAAYFSPLKRSIVRLAMMVIDVSFFSTAMTIIPASSIPLFFIYLLVILGSGFRYGNKYLFAGLVLSIIGFAIAFSLSDYWQTYQSFGLSVLFILITVSVYVSMFIKRLNNAKNKLEIAVAKADAANEAKSNFLANMSHELRTPLNGVNTVCELLYETDLSEIQREYAETIQSSSKTLLDLINDVLDFSKIESDKVILDNICFDLYDSIGDVIKIIKPLADRKNIAVYNNISSHAPQYAYGDPVRIKQILLNLANNAVKFTEQGHVSINTYATVVDNNCARFYFEVIDTGIGISYEAQNKIFDRFVQEDDSTTRQFGGTGLGTSIAKQLVELMNGEIGLSSNPGKGSRFWFEVQMPIITAQDFESLEAEVMIVSDNSKLLGKWVNLLDGWAVKYIVRNSVDAALKVLQVWRHNKKKCSVILDDGVLRTSPVHTAQLINEVGIKELSLMLSSMNPVQVNNPRVQLYYDVILSVPIDSKQLYHALKGTTAHENKDGGIVSQFATQTVKQHLPKQLYVLIAEDQSTNQFVFRRIVESHGHTVTVVEDGQKALDVMGMEKFDVAIVDLNMPHVSGIELIKMFRFMEPDNEMPFVVVTANCSQETLNECKGLADAVLIKPIEKHQLLNVIYQVTDNQNLSFDMEMCDNSLYSDLPCLDIKALEEVIGEECDNEFIDELFRLFRTDANSLVEKIKQNIQSLDNLPEAMDCAHALKGIANNVSAKKVAAVAKYCEEMIQSNPNIIRQNEKILQELDEALKKTNSTIKQYIELKHSPLVDN